MLFDERGDRTVEDDTETRIIDIPPHDGERLGP
jgi:hypothetical protein